MVDVIVFKNKFFQKLCLARIRFFINFFIQGDSLQSEVLVSLETTFAVIIIIIVESRTETYPLTSKLFSTNSQLNQLVKETFDKSIVQVHVITHFSFTRWQLYLWVAGIDLCVYDMCARDVNIKFMQVFEFLSWFFL